MLYKPCRVYIILLVRLFLNVANHGWCKQNRLKSRICVWASTPAALGGQYKDVIWNILTAYSSTLAHFYLAKTPYRGGFDTKSKNKKPETTEVSEFIKGVMFSVGTHLELYTKTPLRSVHKYPIQEWLMWWNAYWVRSELSKKYLNY